MNSLESIEKYLSRSLPGRKIHSTTPLQASPSGRKYYRVSADGDESYIACSQEDGRIKDFVNMQKMLQEGGVNVPTIYDVSLEDGHLLLQDLGPLTMLKKLATLVSKGEEMNLYQNALEQLLRIQSIKTTLPESLNLVKLMEEVRFTLKHLVASFLNYKLSTGEEEELLFHFQQVCQAICNNEKTIIHRDFHSRNLMAIEDKIFVIDFQDGQVGWGEYDLVSLLDDCYYQIRYQNKTELKKYYLAEKGVDEEKFYQHYDYTKLQRIWQAMGRFAYFRSNNNDSSYLKYIGLGFENLRSTLNIYPELGELRLLLSRIYYGN